jgi:hypothetical protein
VDSEIAREFTEGVATPGSVLTGDVERFDDFRFSDAEENTIDADGTPVVTDVSGDPPANVEVGDELP